MREPMLRIGGGLGLVGAGVAGATPETIAAVVVGYLSTPLVSLATRGNWPSKVKFVAALGLSALAALAVVLATDNLAGFERTFAYVFAAQQVTWSLSVPGAGSPSLNSKLEHAGTPTEFYEDHVVVDLAGDA